jgi:hypothetical protein
LPSVFTTTPANDTALTNWYAGNSWLLPTTTITGFTGSSPRGFRGGKTYPSGGVFRENRYHPAGPWTVNTPSASVWACSQYSGCELCPSPMVTLTSAPEMPWPVSGAVILPVTFAAGPNFNVASTVFPAATSTGGPGTNTAGRFGSGWTVSSYLPGTTSAIVAWPAASSVPDAQRTACTPAVCPRLSAAWSVGVNRTCTPLTVAASTPEAATATVPLTDSLRSRSPVSGADHFDSPNPSAFTRKNGR